MDGVELALGGAGIPILLVALFIRYQRKRIQRDPWDADRLAEYGRHIETLTRGRRKRAEERLEMESDWRVALRRERIFFVWGGALLALAAVAAVL